MSDAIRLGHRISYKHNVGNFENVDIEYSIEVTVKEGRTVEETFAHMEKVVDEHIEAKVAEVDNDFKNKR